MTTWLDPTDGNSSRNNSHGDSNRSSIIKKNMAAARPARSVVVNLSIMEDSNKNTPYINREDVSFEVWESYKTFECRDDDFRFVTICNSVDIANPMAPAKLSYISMVKQ